MNDFLTSLLGDLSAGNWMAYLFFATLGVLVASWTDIKARNKTSLSTPKKFSFSFFFQDNFKKFVVTIILIYINFRFWEQITATELSEYSAFLAGLTSDSISNLTKKNVKQLQTNRKKLFDHD